VINRSRRVDRIHEKFVNSRSQSPNRYFILGIVKQSSQNQEIFPVTLDSFLWERSSRFTWINFRLDRKIVNYLETRKQNYGSVAGD